MSVRRCSACSAAVHPEAESCSECGVWCVGGQQEPKLGQVDGDYVRVEKALPPPEGVVTVTLAEEWL